MDKLLQKVLAKITPSALEYASEIALADKLIGKIKSMEGRHVDCLLAGSLARNTHLKGDRDIDIFVLFPKHLSREEFVKEGLRIGKKVLKGYKWFEAYSEHPYLRANVEGYDVEIVPSYKIEHTGELKSAVDRTAFHTKYLLKNLNEGHRSEVRLLRQFMKGIGCYGADLKFASVPGYVIELLILEYGEFEDCLKAIAEWHFGKVIDLEGYWNEKDVRKMFPASALIIIDPIDKGRNVAAALSREQFERMVLAANAFLEKPAEKFFFPELVKCWGIGKIRQMLSKKEIIALQLAYPKNVLPDIMWGELRRLERKISVQLKQYEFDVVRSDSWSDEKKTIALIYELKELALPKTMGRIGPFAEDLENQKRFIAAHKGRIISGPRIEKGRWVIETRREFADVKKLLCVIAKELAKKEKKDIKRAIKSGCRVLDAKGISALYGKNAEFRRFLTRYLKGKEEFME